MASTLPPRIVVVTRPTEYASLLLRHGTRDQAKFFLATRGQKIEDVVERHDVHEAALHVVNSAIPTAWRRARVLRDDLDRFLFEPGDIIVAVGQDGLVANVAKYARGQLVIGVNPSKALYEGVLVRHPPQAVADLLAMARRGALTIEPRTMVRASIADGQELVALNEIFVGHRSHQSARYRIRVDTTAERHSSSGLIVCTGTGASGWARSLSLRREGCPPLPSPTGGDLAFLVREAWPSVATGTSLVHGVLKSGAELVVTSEMNDGGVAFGDGIEDDRLELPFGQTIAIARSTQELNLC